MQMRSDGKSRWAVAVAVVAALAGSVGTASPAAAVIGGWVAADTPRNRATVFVRSTENDFGGKLCSGTLVAPTVVVTAGHCVRHGETRRTGRLPHTPFDRRNPGWIDWEHPNQWYPLYEYDPLDGDSDGENVQISVGVNCSGCRPRWTTTATAYAIPNSADVLALRLAQVVPATEATPAPVLSTAPSWSNGTFTAAGFGRTVVLRTGTIANPTFPCPSGAPWPGGERHKLCFTSGPAGVRSSADTVPGDSGGSIYWTDAWTGIRYLVAVLSSDDGIDADVDDDGVIDRVSYNSGTATFYQGGSAYDGDPLPDMARFFRLVRSSAVAGSMYIVDHDYDSPNDVRDAAFSATLGDAYTAGACRDEVRGVLSVQVTERTSQYITVDVDARLYEGASCSTTDLDGRSRLTGVRIWANTARTLDLDVYNHDEGFDSIRFHFSVSY